MARIRTQAEIEAPIIDSYEKAALTSILRLADRIENIRRLYTQSQLPSIPAVERRDHVVRMNAEIMNVFKETLGYARARNRADDLMGDIEQMEDQDGVSDPLDVLSVLIEYLELFGMYTSSERMPPDDAEIIRKMLKTHAKPMPQEMPRTIPSREETALSEMKAFEQDGEPDA